MIVKQIYTDNDYRNFNYLIVCPETGEAMAVDPLASDLVLSVAKENGWEITKILNTHEHFDHIGGNQAVVDQTGAKVLAHHGARDAIAGMDIGLRAGDTIRLGKTVELEVLDTPGHTMSHVCLLSHTDTPALFCGDTLFNAGAGNCHFGGDPEKMYQTFVGQLATLPNATQIYPGHDYIENNLGFTLDREPENEAAKTLLDRIFGQDTHNPFVSTLAVEKEVNAFFRLHSPEIISHLRDRFSDLPTKLDAQTVFVKLRELRNDW